MYFIGLLDARLLLGLLLLSDARLLLFVVRHCREVLGREVLVRVLRSGRWDPSLGLLYVS